MFGQKKINPCDSFLNCRLWLLTVSWRRSSWQTVFSAESHKRLIDRLKHIHHWCCFASTQKELFNIPKQRLSIRKHLIQAGRFKSDTKREEDTKEALHESNWPLGQVSNNHPHLPTHSGAHSSCVFLHFALQMHKLALSRKTNTFKYV